jgi:hypothetical protein
MVMVVCMLSVCGVVCGTVLSASTMYCHRVRRNVLLEQAMYAAEAGLEDAASVIEANHGYLHSLTTRTAKIGQGSYTYRITKTAWREYAVESEGTVHKVTSRVTVDRAYLPSYAQYSFWNHINGQIYFKAGELFRGHVHSDGKLWFSSAGSTLGGPTFMDQVTSGHDSYGGSLEGVDFQRGFKLNAEEGDIGKVDFSELRSLAGSFGLVLDGDTKIKLDGDDLRITNQRRGWYNKKVKLGSDEIIYVQSVRYGSSYSRRGTVQMYSNGKKLDGRLSIVAEDDILIHDHLRIMDQKADSNDALGLISRDDVWISGSAPNNLDIDAAILATGQDRYNDGSFGVLEYNRGYPRGTFNVRGGIVQEVRGAVGTFNSSTGRDMSGYRKNYQFDERFAEMPPPYFPPVSEQVKFEGWKFCPGT